MKKKNLNRVLVAVLLTLIVFLTVCACGKEKEPVYVGKSLVSVRPLAEPDKTDKYRTFYEIFVYSFWDSDGDGIGDLNGVTEKLDYLNDGDATTDTDLGITGIWLMPIMPSNTYHKYDVKDYLAIDPEYGSMEDFDRFLEECNHRNINVILDLVMNHTSSAHPWFQTACNYLRNIGDAEPDVSECPYLDYYHFTKGMQWGYSKVEGTDWYYEAGFWSEMPDLNLENENVRKEFEEICRFWLEKGVAGFRLDAVKEFVSDDTQANVEILTWLNQMVKSINKDAYLVGEAWTSQTEYAKYYASGMDSLFDFAFADESGNIVKFATGLYKANSLGSYIVRGDERFAAQNPEYVNAPFYSNHDMNRAAGYYSGDWAAKQIKIAAALNMTMSGNVFLYYGDEIGMKGYGKDENKRIGMRWSADSNMEGMCDGPRDADTDIVQTYPSLEEQMQDTESLYTYYKNLIRLRNQFPSIRKGSTMQVDALSDEAVCALLKSYPGSEKSLEEKDDSERTILIYNLSADKKRITVNGISLEDGTVLNTKMLEATLVSGEEAVTTEGDDIVMPEYSVAVLLLP